MRILYIQYAGDFAEAYERLIKKNGKENYYGQQYSVNAVVQQARNNIEVISYLIENVQTNVMHQIISKILGMLCSMDVIIKKSNKPDR